MFEVSSRSSALAKPLRTALVRVLGVETSRVSVTWSTYLPTCGRPPSATSGFHKKSAMSQGWAHRASTLGPHCAGRGGRSCQSPSGRLGLVGPEAEEPNRPSQPSRELSVLLHPALDSELARLPQAKVREMFTSHVKLLEAEPSEDIEHHGRFGAPCVFLTVRSAWQETVAQTHSSQLDLFMLDGSWQRKELPGPPFFQL